MSDYRIDIKVRNNVLLYKLEQAGYESIGGFCRVHNVMRYAGPIGDVAAMKRSPLTSEGEFIGAIKFLAEKLGYQPEDLFTDIQMNTILKTNKRSIKVNEAEMMFMLEQQNQSKLLEEVIHLEQLNHSIENILDTLTPREKRIIQMRNGLGDYSESLTLSECGMIEGVNQERIRQIEANALRKLRHPSRAEIVRPFLNESA